MFLKYKISPICLLTAIILSACGGSGGSNPDADSSDNRKQEDSDTSSLFVKSLAFESTEQCPNGGISIDSGLDTSGDGTLQADEITETQSICNGQDGNALFAIVTDIDSAEICVAGGKEVLVGVDKNSDQLLVGEEVLQVIQICHGEKGDQGESGLSSLIRTEELESGGQCINGGVIIYSGLDLDDDGQLEDAERTQSQLICRQSTLGGLYLIRNRQNSDACLRGALEVLGGVDLNENDQLDDNEITSVTQICQDNTAPRLISRNSGSFPWNHFLNYIHEPREVDINVFAGQAILDILPLTKFYVVDNDGDSATVAVKEKPDWLEVNIVERDPDCQIFDPYLNSILNLVDTCLPYPLQIVLSGTVPLDQRDAEVLVLELSDGEMTRLYKLSLITRTGVEVTTESLGPVIEGEDEFAYVRVFLAAPLDTEISFRLGGNPFNDLYGTGSVYVCDSVEDLVCESAMIGPFPSIGYQIIYNPGETEKILKFEVIDDSVFDEDKTLDIWLTSDFGGQIFIREVSASLTLEVIDSDPPTKIQFFGASQEVDSFVGNISIPVISTSPYVKWPGLDLEVSTDAVENTDYEIIDSSLYFGNNTYQDMIIIRWLNYAITEPVELLLTLTQAEGEDLLGAVTQYSITVVPGDFPIVSFSQDPVVVDASIGIIRIPVIATKALPLQNTIDIDINSTAIEGVDYQVLQDSLFFYSPYNLTPITSYVEIQWLNLKTAVRPAKDLT
ncbi:MAG: hypothetical protein JKY67_03530 [Pseudomonadales bacterium]|nr:hypothetical protein [Pseudomonadales bacterium]